MGRTIFNDVHLPPGVRQSDLDDAPVSQRKRAHEHAGDNLARAVAKIHAAVELIDETNPQNTRICEELDAITDKLFELRKKIRPILDVGVKGKPMDRLQYILFARDVSRLPRVDLSRSEFMRRLIAAGRTIEEAGQDADGLMGQQMLVNGEWVGIERKDADHA